jgi:ectoine hydroxylase-related dioxygenase (phytanoyl-CoA dioxygenase family)
MAVQLAPSIVETYRRDGVVVLKNLVTPQVIDDLARGVESNMAAPGPWANEYTPQGSSGRFFDDYVNWKRFDDFARHATQGPIPQAARELMGSQVARLFHEHVLVKEAETKEVTPWHHDDPYYGIDGMDNVSIWIPLDPIPAGMLAIFRVDSPTKVPMSMRRTTSSTCRRPRNSSYRQSCRPRCQSAMPLPSTSAPCTAHQEPSGRESPAGEPSVSATSATTLDLQRDRGELLRHWTAMD